MTKKRRQASPAGHIASNVVNSGYGEGGASYKRAALRGYTPIKSSVKEDVDRHIRTLRSRSNDMYINSPVGAAAINVSRSNVIGAGLSVSPKIDYRTLGITAEQAKEWQRKTKREFSLWANSISCDLYRKNNFADMQDIAYLSYLVDGDSFAAIKYRQPTPDNPYRLRVQLFEAARVSNPNSGYSNGPLNLYELEQKNPQNGNRIVNGVEIDRDGAVVAYWVSNRIPNDLTSADRVEWVRLDAFGSRTGKPNILQISHEERPEQYRGVPYLAPAIEVLKQVSRYTNAELTAAIIKSFFTLFFTSGTTKNVDDVLGSAVAPHDKVAPEDLDGIEVGPGTLNLLPEGIDVKAIDGSRSLSTFEPFTNNLLTQVGASLGIPSEVLLSRFNASYSAARGALMQAAAAFKTRRTWFARDFCQPVYEAWLAEAIAIGRIKAPGYGSDPLITAAWNNAEWFGPVMGMLDPVKEANGAMLRIKYGLSTGEREAAEITGSSYDDNVSQIGIESQSWENVGLPLPDYLGGGEKDEEQK